MISSLFKSLLTVFYRLDYSYELRQWERMLFIPIELREVIVIDDVSTLRSPLLGGEYS